MRWPSLSLPNREHVWSALQGIAIGLIFLFTTLGFIVGLVVSINVGEEQRVSRQIIERAEAIQIEHERQTQERIAATEASITAIEDAIAKQLQRHDAQTEAALEDLLARIRALRFQVISSSDGTTTIVRVRPEPTPTKPGRRKGNP